MVSVGPDFYRLTNRLRRKQGFLSFLFFRRFGAKNCSRRILILLSGWFSSLDFWFGEVRIRMLVRMLSSYAISSCYELGLERAWCLRS